MIEAIIGYLVILTGLNIALFHGLFKQGLAIGDMERELQYLESILDPALYNRHSNQYKDALQQASELHVASPAADPRRQ